MKLPTFFGVIVSCVSVIAVGNIRATHSADVSSLKACRLPSSDSTTAEGICVPISLCPPMVELKFQLKFAAVRPYVCHIDQQSSTNGDKVHVCCRVSAIKCHGYRQEVKKLAERWDPLGTILSLKPTSASSQQLTHAKANGGRTQHSVKKVCPGEPGEFTALIVNGMPAEPDEFPHMVALGMYKIGMGLHFPCGGSLISDKWVLTAAHCFKEALTIVRIYNGIQEEYNKFDTRRDFYIQERIIHPGYRGSRDTAYADLALVRLQEDGYFVPVKITLRAHPGCLSQFDPELLVNKDTQIVGWGVTRNLGQKSQHLLKGRVPILPKENCSAAISRNYVLRSAYTLGAGNGILCGLDSVQHSDACQGDSGGPMCIRGPHCVYDIVGVVSKGVNCGSKFPGFYIDVFYYLDWIEREVWPVKSVLAELRAEAKDNKG